MTYYTDGYAVFDDTGARVFDLVENVQEAHDITYVLNQGVEPDWDCINEALKQLILVKVLPDGFGRSPEGRARGQKP